MSHSRKPLVLLVGAAVAAGSLFSMDTLAHGYMQDAKAPPAKDSHEGGCGMAKMDSDKDGRLSRAEFDAAHKGEEEKFASHDLDGDGFISQAEMDKHHGDMKAKGDGKATAEGKCGEGKCGEGKCGGNP